MIIPPGRDFILVRIARTGGTALTLACVGRAIARFGHRFG